MKILLMPTRKLSGGFLAAHPRQKGHCQSAISWTGLLTATAYFGSPGKRAEANPR